MVENCVQADPGIRPAGLPAAVHAARDAAHADAARRPARILTFSSIFPSAAIPRHGIFTETRLRHILTDGEMEGRVIAPVPWFPFRSRMFGRYAKHAAAAREEMRRGLEVRYPRYLMLPKLGVPLQAASMAHAAWPEIARMSSGGWVPDLIDGQYLYPDGVAAAMVAQRLRRPFVMTALGTDANVLAKLPATSKRILWAAERAAAIVAVSSGLKDALVAVGVEADKITVLRNGVDLQVFGPREPEAARLRLGLADGPLLACVGNLVAEKGQALAVEMLCHLPGHRLLLVGEGPERAALESMGRALGVGARMSFMASMPQRDLCDVYSVADALLLPSTREGWPNVVLEAMACGTPVVGSDVGAVGEMVTRREFGRVLAGRDARVWAAAVADLLGTRAPPEVIRTHAGRFDWSSIARAQAALFTDAILRARANAEHERGTPC